MFLLKVGLLAVLMIYLTYLRRAIKRRNQEKDAVTEFVRRQK